ncbi:MAG: peptide-methionine (S)-S-oxide reductase MsrA [Gammaproteobacteria bacterium]|nr:peptide-methionine (S)-S-oxide reductase MsrA [Gammaproteobacteria bacterium]
MSQLVLGGGCFWCLEAVFQRVDGVASVTSGYSGGHVDNPDYKSVCQETTGHAEVVSIEYDTNVISLEELLEIFFTIHDPTTLNRQGNDIGTQYRSIIFYQSDAEKEKVEHHICEIKGQFDKPIVTEVKPYQIFWPAESEHFNYYNQNSTQPYCQIVVGSKLQKLNQHFKDKMK